MHKNGKTIKCKVCEKSIYVYPSRLNEKKYCSSYCAHKDKLGFKPKNIYCKLCGTCFVITNQLRSADKYCYSCRNKMLLIRAKEQRERKKNQKHISVCRYCSKTVVSTKYSPQNFCGGKAGKCYKQYLSKTRQGKNNPAYRNGTAVKGKRVYTGIHLRACSKYRKNFLNTHGYLFCEVCGVNTNATQRFEVHHIYFASLYPKHKELHNPRNLILICIKCHNDFHSYKLKDTFLLLEKERKLKELFK